MKHTDDDSKDDDSALIEKIGAAVKAKTKTKDIEKTVGQVATINTSRRLDKIAFEMVNIDVDSDKSQISSLRNTEDAVYWVLSVKTKNPSVVGVAWVKGEMKIFYGAVLPPRA
jgi:replicative DNA helicase